MAKRTIADLQAEERVKLLALLQHNDPAPDRPILATVIVVAMWVGLAWIAVRWGMGG